jgi:hypothetical protein
VSDDDVQATDATGGGGGVAVGVGDAVGASVGVGVGVGFRVAVGLGVACGAGVGVRRGVATGAIGLLVDASVGVAACASVDGEEKIDSEGETFESAGRPVAPWTSPCGPRGEDHTERNRADDEDRGDRGESALLCHRCCRVGLPAAGRRAGDAGHAG